VVTFNYRGNPLVQQARLMAARQDLGKLVFVHGQYLQDWMTEAAVYSWRMETAKGGASSALADVGSHWCDLAEHVSGLRITEVLADLTTAVPIRYEQESAEAFSVVTKKEGAREVKMEGEDLASVLLRFDNGARGSFLVGQVLPGHKNDLQLEINGREASLRWIQEEQNELWIGRHNAPNELMAKDPSLLLDEARAYAHLPGGHQESWADAFRNVIDDAYHWIRAEADPAAKRATVCTFEDGLRTSRLIDAMLRSHAAGGRWQSIEGDASSEPSLSQQEAQPVTP
jgi:predicted dehydrogenase